MSRAFVLHGLSVNGLTVADASRRARAAGPRLKRNAVVVPRREGRGVAQAAEHAIQDRAKKLRSRGSVTLALGGN